MGQALQLKKQCWEDSKKKLGNRHPDTLNALNSYAIAVSNDGRNEEAEVLKKEVYDAFRQMLGEKHPSTLTAMGNWAESLRKLGRRDEAVQLQRKRYNMSRELLGAKHQSTLTAMSNLAIGLGHDSPEYEPLLREVYEAQKKTFGPDPPATKRALQNWE